MLGLGNVHLIRQIFQAARFNLSWETLIIGLVIFACLRFAVASLIKIFVVVLKIVVNYKNHFT